MQAQVQCRRLHKEANPLRPQITAYHHLTERECRCCTCHGGISLFPISLLAMRLQTEREYRCRPYHGDFSCGTRHIQCGNCRSVHSTAPQVQLMTAQLPMNLYTPPLLPLRLLLPLLWLKNRLMTKNSSTSQGQEVSARMWVICSVRKIEC